MGGVEKNVQCIGRDGRGQRESYNILGGVGGGREKGIGALQVGSMS